MKKILFSLLSCSIMSAAFAAPGNFSVQNDLPSGYYIHLGPDGATSSDTKIISNPDGDTWYLDGAYASQGNQANYYVQSPDEYRLSETFQDQGSKNYYNSQADINIYIYNSDNQIITTCEVNTYYAYALNSVSPMNEVYIHDHTESCSNTNYYVQDDGSHGIHPGTIFVHNK